MTDQLQYDVDDLSTWTIEALLDYEEFLYDLEIEGEDVWADRDQVLWELNRRNFGRGDA
jgi:hypothetical protein